LAGRISKKFKTVNKVVMRKFDLLEPLMTHNNFSLLKREKNGKVKDGEYELMAIKYTEGMEYTRDRVNDIRNKEVLKGRNVIRGT
jgi:hypothetical protein